MSHSRRVFRVARSLVQALPLVGAFSLTVFALPLGSAGLDHISSTATHHPPRAQANAATRPESLDAELNTNFVLTVAKTNDSSVTGMINSTFGSYASQALRVARCESGLNPSATNSSSGAAGVFQFLASTWAGTSYARYSRYNAWANIQAAHQVFVRDGYSWREWSCKP
jgi:hypothetical protein